MEIKVVTGVLTEIEAGAVLVNFFEGTACPSGDTAAVDKALDGAVSRLINMGEIKGTLNEITVIHSLGKLPAARVVVIGLGKEKELSQNKVRGSGDGLRMGRY